MTRREEILSQAKALPHFPAPLARIMGYLSKPDADLTVVARFIEYDPGLTVNVLRMANASFFKGAGTGQITSVREALFRLGTRRVLHLVIASGVAPLARTAVAGYGLAPGELLRLSIAVGVAAELLACEARVLAPDYTFTAGLLCNIGKVVLGRYLEVDCEPILALARTEDTSFEQAERTVLGIDHAELGAVLLAHWQLPDPLVACVRWHLDPGSAPVGDIALDLVHVGHLVVNMAGIGQGVDGLQYEACEKSFERLGLDQEAVHATLENLMPNIAEIEDVLSQV